jgi:hypothetical protein
MQSTETKRSKYPKHHRPYDEEGDDMEYKFVGSYDFWPKKAVFFFPDEDLKRPAPIKRKLRGIRKEVQRLEKKIQSRTRKAKGLIQEAVYSAQEICDLLEQARTLRNGEEMDWMKRARIKYPQWLRDIRQNGSGALDRTPCASSATVL